jgi:glycosyltransferase involved in cell wall biosynthesis
MDNRFVIITTCYNVEPYIRMNIHMNRFQSYKNALFIYVDDNSKDTTYSTLTHLGFADDRFLVIKNKDNGSQGKAFMYALNYLESNNLIQDEDIIVEVDGDDWLSSSFVLQYLNEVYQNEHIWMTFGQYQMWPTAQLGGHFQADIHPEVDKQNLHRQYDFPYSHLKTYKYWLLNKIEREDLIDPATGEIFAAAWDHALCLPMVEMAGKDHIFRCPEVLYVLNRDQELQNEGKLRTAEQKQTEQRIREGKVYQRL